MKSDSGQALFLVIIVLAVVLISTLALVSGAQVFYGNSSRSINSEKVTALAEAGLEKAVASLNSSGGVYNGEQETILEDGSFSVQISDVDSTTKSITATGYYPSKADPKQKKTVKVSVSKGLGMSFNYGLQSGVGGITMTNNSVINGSVYSNGNITMSNGSRINGDAYVAGGAQPTPNQEHDCSGNNCFNFEFGRNAGSAVDTAQSFRPSSSEIINKIAVKIKKIGSPANIQVLILGDNNGSPNRSQQLATGTLAASLVSSQYAFIDVNLNSTPLLSANTPYWIVLDTTANSSNYWNWQYDSTSGYTPGAGKWSTNWNVGNPNWSNIAGDLTFKVYMGGVTTQILGAASGTITGDAHAHNLQNLTIQGGAYYQTSSNITAGSMHPNSTDPVAVALPISDANIQEWKDGATSAGVHTGNITTCPGTLSAGKYVGNVVLANNCTVTISSPVWITGILSLSNNNTIKLDQSFGSTSGVLIVDGIITLSNGNKIQGSGTQGSYLILIGNNGSLTSHPMAINVTNGGNAGILYSNWGTINISNNNNLTSVSGYQLVLGNNVVVNYDQGLAGTFFTSGPSGAFSLIKGTYQVK